MEDPRLEWRALQEEMLRQYLTTAQEDLQVPYQYLPVLYRGYRYRTCTGFVFTESGPGFRHFAGSGSVAEYGSNPDPDQALLWQNLYKKNRQIFILNSCKGRSDFSNMKFLHLSCFEGQFLHAWIRIQIPNLLYVTGTVLDWIRNPYYGFGQVLGFELKIRSF